MMKMKMTSLLITAFCATLATGMVVARGMGPQQPTDELLAALDTDGDGMISREEHEAARAATFDEADTNGDSYLSMEELEALQATHREERLTSRFDTIDTDADGYISYAEFLSASPQGDEAQVEALYYAFCGDDELMDLDEFATFNSPESADIKRFIALDSDADGLISEDEFGEQPTRGTGLQGPNRSF